MLYTHRPVIQKLKIKLTFFFGKWICFRPPKKETLEGTFSFVSLSNKLRMTLIEWGSD